MTIGYARPNAAAGGDGLSWDTAYDNIQDCYDDGHNEIWLGRGVFYVTSPVAFEDDDVTIYGGFSLLLQGTDGSTSQRWSYTIIDGASTYQGMTITDCTVTLDRMYVGNCAITGNGAGISITDGEGVGALVMSDGSIYGCAATVDGGGIYAANTYAVGTSIDLDNVTIYECTAGGTGAGVHAQDTCDVTATSCNVYDNTSTGYGGGFYLGGDDTNTHTITKCKIYDNTGSNGGAVLITETGGGNVDMTNCVVTGNTGLSADRAIQVYNAGTVTITNCTIADNTGVAIRQVSGTVNAINCQIWDNGSAILGTVTPTYCNYSGGSGTNVDDDPLFTGTGNDPYSLGGLSDSIDAGNSGATNYPSTDILGQSRYDDPNTSNTGAGSPAYSDIGAYEFQGVPNNTMNMSNYFINLGADVDSQDPTRGPMIAYAIIQLPEMPRQFISGSRDGRFSVRHQITSEIEIDESDSTTEERVGIDGRLCAYRETDGDAYTTPTRAVDYDANYQSEDDTEIAEDYRYPEGEPFSTMFEIGDYYRYAIITMMWDYTKDDAADVIHIYNVDVNQIMDQDYAFNNFESCIHPGTTIIAPDVPVSAWHISQLQDSLLKMIYEGRVQISIPVFGQYSNVVV